MLRPKVFIASSTEGLEYARFVQENFERDLFEVEIWNQNVFEPSEVIINELEKLVMAFDFGIFIFTPDDTTEIKGGKMFSARDNVLFELGLFGGQISMERCFILKPLTQDKFRIPSDLSGLLVLDFDSSRSNMRSALEPSCNKIRQKIARLGVYKPSISIENIKTKTERKAFLEDYLQMIVRSISIPNSPDLGDLRAFIFKKEKDELICGPHWALHPIDEPTGILKFKIDTNWSHKVCVVRTVLERDFNYEEVVEDEQDKLSNEKVVSGKLVYIIAAPIFNPDGSVWGVIDLDTSNEKGKELLKSRFSKTTIMQFAKHLQQILPILK